jgi:hypothetical protein
VRGARRAGHCSIVTRPNRTGPVTACYGVASMSNRLRYNAIKQLTQLTPYGVVVVCSYVRRKMGFRAKTSVAEHLRQQQPAKSGISTGQTLAMRVSANKHNP